MRRNLIPALLCPSCGSAELAVEAGSEDPIVVGSIRCPNGHRMTIANGVLNALLDPTADIAAQLAENARERAGDLSQEERAEYTLNISRIGTATYNELIRANAGAALDGIAVKSGRSLDLGGGSAWLADELARRGFEAVSLDIQDPYERRRQVVGGVGRRLYELVTDLNPELGQTGADYVVGDMERLPFAPRTFDLVTTSAALHHSEDPVKTLRQAADCLTGEGVLVCLNEPVKGVFRNERPIMGGRGAGAGEHIYWAREYLDFFRQAGLEVKLGFPGWIHDRLLEGRWDGVVYYRRLLPLVAALYRRELVQFLLRGPFLRPAQDLFGLTLTAVARRAPAA